MRSGIHVDLNGHEIEREKEEIVNRKVWGDFWHSGVRGQRNQLIVQ
jgi:hypothetical protein